MGIVTQNSGYIDVYRKQKQGSVFNIYLPSAMKEPNTQLPLADNEPPAGNETILKENLLGQRSGPQGMRMPG